MPAKLRLNFGDKLRADSRLTFLFDSEDRISERRCGFFLCECGEVVVKAIDWVKRGSVKSCGCKRWDGSSRTTHGMSKDPLYQTWRNMIARCYNQKHPLYPYYGARNITVCSRWSDSKEGPINFINDMGSRPDGHSLDRIDTNQNYSPENCQWSNGSDQCFNRRKQKNNTSGVPGVHWREDEKKWVATIKKNGEMVSLGVHKDFYKAVEDRRKAEIDLYGYNNNYWMEEEDG